jgi:hypothetical protein
MCYGMNESDFYSFACTVASAFSNGAEKATFESDLLFHPSRLAQIEKEKTGSASSLVSTPTNEYRKDEVLLMREERRARDRLVKIMDIVFSKLKQKKILVESSKPNIYRYAPAKLLVGILMLSSSEANIVLSFPTDLYCARQNIRTANSLLSMLCSHSSCKCALLFTWRCPLPTWTEVVASCNLERSL